MAQVADLFLEYGQDLVLTTTGDLQLATEWDFIRQQIERFLLTNPATTQSDGTVIPADNIWEPTVGLGATVHVGDTYDDETVQAMENLIYQATLNIPGVSATVPPVITSRIVTPQEVEFNIIVTLTNGQQNTILITVP